MNRFDRIVSILIQLQSRKVVRAGDMAERFDVSLRTIYRDIRTLEEAGVPLIGEAGNGYSLVDDYRLPPVMFTREEALSFMAAEKLMEGFTDANLQKNYSAAMYKLKSVLRGPEQEMLTQLEGNIAVGARHQSFNTAIPDALEILMEAIAEKRCVQLHYQSFDADEVTKRMIEPIGIFHENNFWYVMGYCQLREDYRQFRTDRMVSIRRTDQFFDRVHQSLASLRERDNEEGERIRATVHVDKEVMRYIKSGTHYFGLETERDCGKYVEMVFLIHACFEDFPRWIISFGDHVKVAGPDALKNKVKELLDTIVKNVGV